MKKPIRCRLFENGYDSPNSGPCCLQPISGVSNFRELHDNSEYKTIKKSFEEGKWPEGYCIKCRNIEKINNPNVISKRQAHLHEIDNLAKHEELKILVIDTGRLCNLQCRSCNSFASTSWDKEHDHLPKLIKWSDSGPFLKKQYNYLDDDFSNLEVVSLLGGEPAYNIDGNGILKKIYNDTNGNCDIGFTTNATVTLNFDKNPWLLNFKSITVMLSLDAIGSASDFIRTGSNWSTIEKNIQYYKTIPNVYLGFHPTFSVLNLFEVDKLFHWTKEQNITRSTETTFVTSPEYLSFRIFTDAEKIKLKDYLTNKSLNFLIPPIELSKFSPKLREKFFMYMKHTKEYHNLDWKDYLPELYNFLNFT